MNLILQGLNTDRAAMISVIALVQPRRVVEVDTYIWRCEGRDCLRGTAG